MIPFQISGYLTELAGGQAVLRLDVAQATVVEALGQLWKAHVGLRDRVLTEQGDVRPHVNVFVNSQVVRRDHVLDTQITGDAEICIMPAARGGGYRPPEPPAQLGPSTPPLFSVHPVRLKKHRATNLFAPPPLSCRASRVSRQA